MTIARIVIRFIAAWIFGGVVTALLFVLVAWLTGQWPPNAHSDAAAVLLVFPFALAAAFWLLARAGFPRADNPEPH